MNGRVGIGLHRYLTKGSFKQTIKFLTTDGLECSFIGSSLRNGAMGRDGRAWDGNEGGGKKWG